MTKRLPVSVFFALFTVSGFAGLIYESIWSHYLKLFLGHAAYAQTLVLAIFMGGMALGSWLVSRYTNRIANLLLGYALAELGIGVLAILFHRVFGAATGWAYESVLPALHGSGVDLFKWSLASLLILPASVLLGTTFPLMSGGIMRLHPETGGRSLAMLYFTNSFGAAIGVLASGFLLIDRLGLPGTILTAGILNVALAITVWGLARGLPAAAAPLDDDRTGARAAAGPQQLGRAVLLLACATGAASFIYEITWIRMLTLGLGASTHAFEVMLAAFILAMSLGSLWFRNRISRTESHFTLLTMLLVAKALLAVLAIWAYSGVLDLVAWTLQAVARNDAGYSLNTAAGMVASMLLMFPTAFCAGATLPLATHVLTARGHGERAIGRVYGANTAGCILGAVLATHVGMELLGVKGLTGLGALFDVGAAALIAASAGAGVGRRAKAAAAAIAVAGAVFFVAAPLDLYRMASGIYRQGVFYDPAQAQILFYRDGKTATISVVQTGVLRSIRTNGKPDASIVQDTTKRASPDESTMILAAALPLAVKPDARLVANIGFGSGLTTHALLGSPRLAELDSIEIEPMMIEGAKLFQPRNRRAFGDPRSHLQIEDAKTFFASAGKRYDVIVSEPSNPWVSGVSTLFSREFYANIKRYLQADGVLVQWVQAYEIDLGLLSSIFNALGEEFGDYTVYRTGVDLLVVATPAAKLPPLRGDLFNFPGLAEDLRYLGFQELADLEALRVGGRGLLAPLFMRTGFPPNSDYFPIIDQRAPRALFRRQGAMEVSQIPESVVPLGAFLDAEARTPVARVASAGLNRPLRVGQTLIAAEAIGVAISGNAERAGALQAAERTPALLVHGLLADCRGAQGEFLAAVHDIARLALPVLQPGDAQPLFERIADSPCGRSLQPAGRHWVSWLRALNQRDAVGVAEHAGVLLAEGLPPAVQGERGRVLASAMAAELARGRVAAAVALRDRHFASLAGNQRQDLVLRLVLAQADERSLHRGGQ